jgi:uncharacterized membrane protein required for colicin V production
MYIPSDAVIVQVISTLGTIAAVVIASRHTNRKVDRASDKVDKIARRLSDSGLMLADIVNVPNDKRQTRR